jgi:hypothetical protein
MNEEMQKNEKILRVGGLVRVLGRHGLLLQIEEDRELDDDFNYRWRGLVLLKDETPWWFWVEDIEAL